VERFRIVGWRERNYSSSIGEYFLVVVVVVVVHTAP
jgi:hypothetical protein